MDLEVQGGFILPAFIYEIYHQSAEDEEDEESNEHVVDGPDVVHFKKLTDEDAGIHLLSKKKNIQNT